MACPYDAATADYTRRVDKAHERTHGDVNPV